VPCNWIYENCKYIKICDNDKCVCSSGYNSANENCYNRKITHVYTISRRSTPKFLECESGRYGVDVKNLAENAPTTIITCAIGLTEHAPLALMDSADQDAIYVCKIKIPFKNN
jgi:hypothetical protein